MINDSGQIAATSSARLRALARVRPGGRASGRETIGDALVSGRGRAPVARNKGSASRPRGKFSSLQILENSQNAERISILPEPAPQAQGTRCADGGGAARVGHAHDPSVLVRRVIQNQVSQRCVVPAKAGIQRPRTCGKVWMPAFAGMTLTFLSHPPHIERLTRLDLTAKQSRPQMAPQQLEKIESAPGNGMVSEASNLQHLVLGAR